MHEYEFRLVIQHSEPLTHLLDDICNFWPIVERRHVSVTFAKPHFRFRNGHWEVKRIISAHAVYHDTMWFKWVHSQEVPFKRWSRATHCKFLDVLGHFQDPFYFENRDYVQIDSLASVYTFRDNQGVYRLVFEWEYGEFSKALTTIPYHEILNRLQGYRQVYTLFRHYPPPPYELKENLVRKPVVCIKELPHGDQYLLARKMDGTFGFVMSFTNHIKEKWEGYERRMRPNMSLGDGIIFSAEKCESIRVLLDVYQVRGLPIASWCRRAILTEFLPSMNNILDDYRVQCYSAHLVALPVPQLPTDGLIIHDVLEDVVYKKKNKHSLDVVYNNGWFWIPELPNREPGPFRFKSHTTKLEDGQVYEVSMKNGRVIRKRPDRFTGNTAKQIKAILECSHWGGPPFEKLNLKGKIKTSGLGCINTHACSCRPQLQWATPPGMILKMDYTIDYTILKMDYAIDYYIWTTLLDTAQWYIMDL
ncbi:uncharacterized protein CDAR_304801 [Caerostris darwini]|uniref:Uncharacterized protein n=1 Tax=Caerostris darwini TaxID=1538125 RepID=A0AAV4Q7C5_9ARAC|nr:uncharacterized protein CDAR_304801 [Caerostris darwini]